MKEQIKKCKLASLKLNALSEETRKKALLNIAHHLREKSSLILKENLKDIQNAQKNQLSQAMLDRLLLNEARIEGMAKSCEEIAKAPQILGEIIAETKKENGLIIQKERVPLGVILMIFESRPNVVIDSAALAIKSGNALILKGGKEAKFSNAILGDIIHDSLTDLLPQESLIVLESDKREATVELLQMNDLIDVVIPRGGEQLIRSVYEKARMPVIAHYKGLCHIYIDQEVEEKIILPILLNAKTQRPGVCNAMETLLYHQNTPRPALIQAFKALQEKGVEIFADEKSRQEFSQLNFSEASSESFETEYLDLKLSLKQVESLEEAILHIQKYGSHHTEAILSSNPKTCEQFRKNVDASLIALNASTRFNDGGELGLGAEIGISTSKFHAYGAMGAREMTAIRHVLKGEGQIRI